MKSDVWCLGIMILELLTGKFPANYLRHGKGRNNNADLATWVDSVVREEWTGEVFDKDIMGTRNGEGEMLKLLRIGMFCCKWSSRNTEEVLRREGENPGKPRRVGIIHGRFSTVSVWDGTISECR